MDRKKNIFYKTHKKIKEAISVRKKAFLWRLKGRPVPPPHAVKQMVIKSYAARFQPRIFVETGTYMGEMIDAVLTSFPEIISIEYAPDLAQRAKAKFSDAPHVKILQGDSGQLLPEVIAKIKEPCLFWLDSHYSGDGTAKLASETPIVKEIKAVLEHDCPDHVVLIDDAREFVGKNDYPTLEELRQIVCEYRRGWQMSVDADIIRIHK